MALNRCGPQPAWPSTGMALNRRGPQPGWPSTGLALNRPGPQPLKHILLTATFLLARGYASACISVLAVVVCLCLCPSHAGIVSKRLHGSSWFFCAQVSLNVRYAVFWGH